jgi:hypothetical protein
VPRWFGYSLTGLLYVCFAVHIGFPRETPISRLAGVVLGVTFVELVIYAGVAAA